jgi:hypothetical protein
VLVDYIFQFKKKIFSKLTVIVLGGLMTEKDSLMLLYLQFLIVQDSSEEMYINMCHEMENFKIFGKIISPRDST